MPEGRYVYCVAANWKAARLGKIGIEENEVYTIPYQEIAAVVHDCPPMPYESQDKTVVEKWVVAHETVIETAQATSGTVLPLGFDTIIKADDDENVEEKVKDWLKDDYQKLRETLDRVKGKREYVVQVSWDTKLIARELMGSDQELKDLDQQIKAKSKGAAYMYRQKLEKLLGGKLEQEANRRFHEFYDKIRSCIDEMKVEKLKKEQEPRQMLMNLSCLADQKEIETLGEELERIANMAGIFVRFTGPWPPYSFV